MKRVQGLRWAFSSLGCPELGLEGVVALAVRHGIGLLELRTVEDRVDLPALLRERHGSPAAVRRLVEAAGLTVAALDASLKLVGNTERDRAELLEFMEWAEALGTPHVRVFDGGSPGPDLGDADLRAAAATIAWWRAERARRGWRTDIMVETHDCLTTARAVRRLQAALDEPVAVLWDTHHTWKKGGEAPPDTWAALRAWVPHVHVKDSVSKPSARHPFTYVLPGDGEFDLSGVLGMLQRDAFAGVVSLEWERKWHPYLPPLDDALGRMRQLGWW